MQDYYQLLGINNSASDAEIRRAYRILARRYHPDLNPNKQAAEKFKVISEAYRELIDSEKRREYDRAYSNFKQASFQRKYEAFSKAKAESGERAENYYKNQKKDFEFIKAFSKKNTPKKSFQPNRLIANLKSRVVNFLSEFTGKIKFYKPKATLNKTSKNSSSNLAQKISIIEVSVSILEALQGVRKTIEIEETEGVRRIRVQIPAAVRSGSVIRMRSTAAGGEELVLIIRVAQHPFMHIDARGLVVDIPVTLTEAYFGASIKVPTVDEDPIMLKIPAGSQSGDELRVRGKGIMEKPDRGDLIYRLMIQHPGNSQDTELQKRVSELGLFYTTALRQGMPKTLTDAAKIR